ncbi:sulfate/thiosulfate ABC transporter permease CysT [Candidatus Blochmannia ocreatus (nom. nud.)]|uniref:Sulfate transport system permease protein CysT n=1 Tax=Candidatus Blochmannia ocreatus (nom. nud.) TaxID=251538 RepID=A0ABY4SUH7_9ENTR|nr:sulfate/thiosulfate ABC transporter permease CysT [Candidatus Blochmannia ocreatus]URJ24997.1 sulfate/thiosulfate ABC transporter permease CysT [Candidatus Blochmannia ocreatus]
MLFFLSKNSLPGFGIAFGSSILFMCLIILLPLSALFMQLSHMSVAQYWDIITDPELLESYKITFFTAGVAAVFNSIFGVLISWVIARYRFIGRTVLDVLIDLPFALPTAVAGLTLATLFSKYGWYGEWLFNNTGVTVSYTWMGISIAMIFTSFPFVVRAVQPVLEECAIEIEEAAKTLGASTWQIFYKIIFPELLPAWLSGTSLSFVRSLGEFGAVIFISGNFSWKNEVVSLIIFVRLQEFDYPAASAIASVILMISLLLLFFVNIFQLCIHHKYIGS